jgi:hypothetical protein
MLASIAESCRVRYEHCAVATLLTEVLLLLQCFHAQIANAPNRPEAIDKSLI